MTTDSAATPAARTADSLLRVESQAIYLALLFGAIGAVIGLAITAAQPFVRIAGSDSLGFTAAALATATAVIVSSVGYARSRFRPGQEWRLDLGPWTTGVTIFSVVVVHSALAFLATYALYVVLSLAFVGMNVSGLFAVVMLGVTLGLTAYLVFPSVARTSTQRLSTLLMAYIAVGCLTAAVTTSDKLWWSLHFSQLGTYGDISSWMFNATLVAGGLLVTTFAVYISHDMRALVAAGRLADESSPRSVSTMFVIMGIMLAVVGLVPVDVSFWIHTLAAAGMAIVFLVLIIRGRHQLSGMPRTYFVASWAIAVAILVTIALYLTNIFSLTALEIVVFALIFGWIAMFIRFLGVVAEEE